jgi:hypothetical protein
MYTLLILCVLLCPSTQDKINKDAPSKYKAGHPTGQSKNKTLPTEATNTPEQQPTTYADSEQNKSQSGSVIQRIEVVPQSDSWFKWYVFATFIIAVLNLGALAVFWLQRKAMSGQLKEMVEARKQTDCLIRQAEISANASKKSADALVASERAWVMADLFCPPGGLINKEPQASLHVYCVCKNEGKTPAWITEINCELAFVETLAGLPDFSKAQPCRFEPESIAAGQERRYPLDLRCVYEHDKLFIVYGMVKYLNMFDNPCTTTFAYRIGENARFNRIASFPEYNQNT